jgi:hypothetical protein
MVRPSSIANRTAGDRASTRLDVAVFCDSSADTMSVADVLVDVSVMTSH